MSNENELKDLKIEDSKIEDSKIEDLEKPLTEEEMKETTGGADAPLINKRRRPGGSN